MISHVSTLFYIKRSKLLANGEAPIYLRITANGKLAECAMKISVPPNLWDNAKHRMKGSSSKAHSINDLILSSQNKIYDIKRRFLDQGLPIDAKSILKAYMGKKQASFSTLLSGFQDHNEKMLQLVGREYSKATWVRYNTSISHLQEFLRQKLGVEDVLMRELDQGFIMQFEHFLKVEKGCMHNSAMKHVKSLKKVVKRSIELGQLDKDPFIGYKVTIKRTSRNYLSEEELQRLHDAENLHPRLQQVLDGFLFQCYTGLSYIDLCNLKRDQIRTGPDGKQWIFTSRQKTGVELHIPLLSIPLQLIDKYKERPGEQLLPIISNQKLNAYLKEIASLCQIETKLTTHVARHTFATTVTLSKGIPIHVVSSLLGHTKIQTTQIYSRVNDKMIAEEMNRIR